MNKFFVLWFALTFMVPTGRTADKARGKSLEQSIVLLDIKRKNYDYFQPWTTPMQNLQKFGVVVNDKEILTTAEGLADRTLLRLQKEGRGKWYMGEVFWIDYHANLALVRPADDSFWKGMRSVELAHPIDPAAPMQVLRWRAGKLETRRAEFNQFTVEDAKLSYAQYLQMEVNSEITGAGWGEALIADGKVVGLVNSQNGDSCKAIPSSFIHEILEARKKGSYRGLGFFDFVWQQAENPSTLRYLNLEGEQRGVIVIEVPKERLAEDTVKPRDIILEIDGFDIDTTGDYRDPDYGHLLLENLATRKKWAGDEVRMKVWRNGKLMNIKYRIPKADYASRLVPDAAYDAPPEYFLMGGLVFQPLSNAYLRSWGPDWRRRAPFRLYYYNNLPQTKERPSLVVLSQVLPDAFNLGYQEYRFLAVDKANGVKVSKLDDLRQALEKPVDGFHILELMEGDSLRRMVLDAGELEKATQRVLSRYGIEKDHVVASK